MDAAVSHDDGGDELMVTSTATLVCIDLAERKAVPVPGTFRERVAAFEGQSIVA